MAGRDAGAYVVTATYATPPFGGLDPAPCAGSTSVATVAFTVSSPSRFPWLVVLVVAGVLVVGLTVVLLLVVRRRGRRRRAHVVVATVLTTLAATSLMTVGARPAEARLAEIKGPPEFVRAVGDCFTIFEIDARESPDMKQVVGWLRDPNTALVTILPWDGIISQSRPFYATDPQTGRVTSPNAYKVEVDWNWRSSYQGSGGANIAGCSTLYHELVHA